ncbi:MAG: VTT domain-containing protein [Candidatus Korarchaeota archaeon]
MKKIYMLIFLAIFSASIAFIAYLQSMGLSIREFTIRFIISPIQELGAFAPPAFLGIMIGQAIIVPIPSEILLFAGGMLFDFLGGMILGLIGSIISAEIAFYIGRYGGRPLAEKMVGADALAIVDRWIQRWGTWAIVLARLLPFVAFDPFSYGAGMTPLSNKKFVFGTIAGLIPRVIFYSFLGALLRDVSINIETQEAVFNMIMLLVFGIFGIMFLMY